MLCHKIIDLFLLFCSFLFLFLVVFVYIYMYTSCLLCSVECIFWNKDILSYLNCCSRFFSAYNDKVVSFLRQPNAIDILKERHPTFKNNSTLRQKVQLIRNDGVEALERLSNDIELIILLRYVLEILKKSSASLFTELYANWTWS